jgi:hypothetical protein
MDVDKHTPKKKKKEKEKETTTNPKDSTFCPLRVRNL